MVRRYRTEEHKKKVFEIGTRIKEFREQLKLTQNALARRAGTTQSNLSAIEDGGRELSAIMIIALSDALGKSCDEILKGPGEWRWHSSAG